MTKKLTSWVLMRPERFCQKIWCCPIASVTLQASAPISPCLSVSSRGIISTIGDFDITLDWEVASTLMLSVSPSVGAEKQSF